MYLGSVHLNVKKFYRIFNPSVLSLFRRFYFGETGTVTVEGLIRLYTDLRYVVEAHRLTGLAAQLGTVFEYQFSHQVRYSFTYIR